MTETTTALDSMGIRDAFASLPDQVADAVERARGIPDLPGRDDIEHVVVLGMGGSGIAGDVIAAAAGPFLGLPILVCKTYQPPAFVGDNSLVFAISFSGDTEETVEAATEAAVQGARMVVVTGGGELARRGESWGAPVVPVPSDIPQPRAGLGAMAIPPLVILEDIGLFPGASQWIAHAVRRLRTRRDRLLGERSEARTIAKRIGRTIPLIYGGSWIGSVAAQRWKTQCNENAKVPAFWNANPEVCHNEIAGWGQHGDLTRQAITLVLLRDDFEHPQVVRRMELVKTIMGEVVAGAVDVRAAGEGQLAQLLDLILVGDLMSVELAMQEGVDPGPVPILGEIKRELRPG